MQTLKGRKYDQAQNTRGHSYAEDTKITHLRIMSINVCGVKSSLKLKKN